MTTKYKNILFAGLMAMVILVTSSCVEQDPYQGAATVSASSPSVTIQADDFQNIPGVEADGTYTYTITLSEPQIADVKFEVFQSGGTATAHEDYDLGESSIVIPAYETSGSGSITFYADDKPEETETLQITIGDNTTANVNYEAQVYDFVLDNYVADALDITFAWETGLIYDGDEYSACDYIDLDYFVADAAGFDINDPMANTYAFYEAATGDCPETMTLELEDWDDGEYIIWADLYGSQYYFLWEEKPVPITSTFTRAGVFKKTLVQDNEDAMLSTQPGDAEGGVYSAVLAKVAIEGGVFVIYDTDGEVVAAGKKSDLKLRTPRPDYK